MRPVNHEPSSTPPSTSETSPILILGLARSGTTWLGKIFDAHPDTSYRHEPDLPTALLGIPRILISGQPSQWTHVLRDFVAGLPSLRRVRASASLPVFPKRGEGFLHFQARKAETWAVRLASLRLGNFRLPEHCLGPDFANRRLVWKSVWSVGRAAALLDAIPSIHIVLLLRHPCGVIYSRHRGVRAGVMAPVLHDEFSELLGFRHHEFAGLDFSPSASADRLELEAYRWACLNSKAMKEIEGNDRCCWIRYEDLCRDPEATVRAIFDRVQLAWNPRVARFLKRSTSRDTRRFYSVYRKGESLDAWKVEMSANERKRVERIVANSEAGRLYFGGRG